MGVTAKEAYEKHMHQIQHPSHCDSYTAQQGTESTTLRHLKMLHLLKKITLNMLAILTQKDH